MQRNERERKAQHWKDEKTRKKSGGESGLVAEDKLANERPPVQGNLPELAAVTEKVRETNHTLDPSKDDSTAHGGGKGRKGRNVGETSDQDGQEVILSRTLSYQSGY